MKQALDINPLLARHFPALVAIAPALTLIFAVVLATQSQPTRVLGLIAILSLLYVFSSMSEPLGRRLESGAFVPDGKSWTTWLRHGDDKVPDDLKTRIHHFCAVKTGRAAPSAQEEADNAVSADAFYVACGHELQEATSDSVRFPLLHEELATYVFRRNLLGLKVAGLTLNAFVVLISITAAIHGIVSGTLDHFAGLLLVLLVAALHAAYFVYFVTIDAVVEAADAYASQLVLSAEALIADGA